MRVGIFHSGVDGLSRAKREHPAHASSGTSLVVAPDFNLDWVTVAQVEDRQRGLNCVGGEEQGLFGVDLNESKLRADSKDKSKNGAIGLG
jgi:hypothetical protein